MPQTPQSKLVMAINERAAFDSTGWQTGLETFGPTRWVSVYGAWMIILRVAATAKRRGVLAGDEGEPFSANRIARPAGVDPTLIEDAMQWAIESGWLVPLDISPGDSPGDLPYHREKIIATGQNRTEPNRTGPDRTGQRNLPARPGPDICKQKQPTTILAAMQLRAAKEPRVLEILERKIDNCEGAPTEQLQCWTESCGWKDEHILNLAKGRDIECRSIARSSVLAWYRRQLFAPDPVIFEASAAAASVSDRNAMIFGFLLIVVGFWIRAIALERQTMKLASPPLRNEDWITDKCAAHLANVPVARIRQAVQSEGLAAKTKLIGHIRFDLVSRSDIVEHFHLDHKSCLASCE